MVHEPSALSGLRGLNGLMVFFTRKFQLTSVTKSRMDGNERMGSTVTTLPGGNESMRVMHIRLGLPLISAEHEPHFPALQFQRHAKSGACSA